MDTPSAAYPCSTGAEDTRHFLLICPLFSDERETLLLSIDDLLNRVNLPGIRDQYLFFFYGNHRLNNADNRFTLLSTIKFIKDTKRFLN